MNPGQPASLHRLNRTEYANAVRDLIGVDVDPEAILPPDEQAFGFDTNADALAIEPSLLDRYVSAAAKIAREAVGDPTIPPAFERYGAIKDNSNEQTYLWQKDRLGEDFPLGSRGGIAARHYFPVDGEYVFKLRLQRTFRERDPRPERAESLRDPRGREADRAIHAGWTQDDDDAKPPRVRRSQPKPEPNRRRTRRRFFCMTGMRRCRCASR